MAKVRVHMYDVTNGSEKTNRSRTIVRMNNILYGIGLGGIFHSAVQVYGDEEWSFGMCEEDTGVFSGPAGKSTMFNYRKTIVLGETNLNIFQVEQILIELSKKWPGYSYDPLSRNCNHFCEELSARLGVPKLPGWVNRLANAGDAAREGAENTLLRFRKAKTNIVSASKIPCRFFSGVKDNVKTGLDFPCNSNRGGSTRVQTAWFKNLITRPCSSCSKITRKRDKVVLHINKHETKDDKAMLLQSLRLKSNDGSNYLISCGFNTRMMGLNS